MITLPIKRRWFDMIISGRKLEEYRSLSPHYASYFYKYKNKVISVKLRNGYKKNSPYAVVIVIPTVGKGRTEWGAEVGKKYWVLKIIQVVNQT